MTLFYKMYRAYYISLFYLTSKKYKESVGFIFKVESYLKQAESGLKTLPKTELNVDDLSKQLKDLSTELNQSKYKIQSAAILESSETSSISDQTEFTKEQLEKTVIFFLNFSKINIY